MSGCVRRSLRTQAPALAGDPPDDRPLIDQPPFDLIWLKPEAGGASVRVLPIPLPGRQVPANPPGSEKLRVVLTRFPEREYEVRWRDIARIDLYEQHIFDEALRKISEKDFIGAFQNLSFLMKNYPRLPRLEELRQQFLLKSAADRFQAGEYRQTLSALEELRATAPDYQAATVMKVLSQVADGLLVSYQKQGDLASVETLLERLRKTYGPTLPVVVRWEKQFEALAASKLEQAQELLERKQYREARRAISEMIGVASNAGPAEQILSQVQQQYPMVQVGVMQRSALSDPTSLVDWAARRTGKLVSKALFQFVETGPEGGRYGFALGSYRLSDDRQQLLLSLDPQLGSSLDAFHLSQVLGDRASPGNPQYDANWAAIFHSVATPSAGPAASTSADLSASQVLVRLRRPNVLPHALLQWTIPADSGDGIEPLLAAYQRSEVPEERTDGAANGSANGSLSAGAENELVFSLRPEVQRHGQPLEVVELFYDDPQRAVNDLLRGQIDVLDQLYPADAKRLAIDPRVRVGAYALPSTHMLLPVSNHPYLSNLYFRRALLLATDRQSMLTQELLGSQDLDDGRLVSGPFPLGRGGNDPLAYAYNTSVQPTETNPQLARLLLIMAEEQLKESAKRNGQPAPQREKIVVGCPDYDLARVAVQAMIQQWSDVGIEAEMLVLASQESFKFPVDLIYATTTMWEPATDIQRLLGSGGAAASDNPFIVQALETLRLARNWREVRTSLQELHQLIDYHLPVLPLWQITDRFAVRRYLEGLSNQPLTLYQEIADWRINVVGGR